MRHQALERFPQHVDHRYSWIANKHREVWSEFLGSNKGDARPFAFIDEARQLLWIQIPESDFLILLIARVSIVVSGKQILIVQFSQLDDRGSGCLLEVLKPDKSIETQEWPRIWA